MRTARRGFLTFLLICLLCVPLNLASEIIIERDGSGSLISATQVTSVGEISLTETRTIEEGTGSVVGVQLSWTLPQSSSESLGLAVNVVDDTHVTAIITYCDGHATLDVDTESNVVIAVEDSLDYDALEQSSLYSAALELGNADTATNATTGLPDQATQEAAASVMTLSQAIFNGQLIDEHGNTISNSSQTRCPQENTTNKTCRDCCTSIRQTMTYICIGEAAVCTIGGFIWLPFGPVISGAACAILCNRVADVALRRCNAECDRDRPE